MKDNKFSSIIKLIRREYNSRNMNINFQRMRKMMISKDGINDY